MQRCAIRRGRAVTRETKRTFVLFVEEDYGPVKACGFGGPGAAGPRLNLICLSFSISCARPGGRSALKLGQPVEGDVGGDFGVAVGREAVAQDAGRDRNLRDYPVWIRRF